MDERVAHFENVHRGSSTQNTNPSESSQSRISLRRTNTALPNSINRELRPRPLSRQNAASFRGLQDYFNVVAERTSSRQNSEEQRRRSSVIAEESAENEVEMWQFHGRRHEKVKTADEALGLKDIHKDEGNEHYVVETLKEGADGPELNIAYYQVTRKTVMRGADFRDKSGRQYSSHELTLSRANANTDSGIYVDPVCTNHDYESLHLEVPDIETNSGIDVDRFCTYHDYESLHLEVPEIETKADVKMETSDNSKLSHIVKELIDTENNYISILEKIVNEYKPYLETEAPVGLQGKSKYIFGNIPDILKAGKEFLSCLLKKDIHDVEGIADVFLDLSSMFQQYRIYSVNKQIADYYLSQFKGISAKKQKELDDSLDLSNHMMTPIQRIGRYKLLLEEIQKDLEKQNRFSQNVEEAVKMIKKEMQKCNDSIAIASIVSCSIDLTKYGSYIMRDQFKVKQKKINMDDVTVFLFDKIVVFTQRSERSKNTDFEEFKYIDDIKIDTLFVRTRPEPTMIELLTKDNSQSYTLQAETNVVRDNWMNNMEKVFQEQLVEVKAQHNVEIRPNLNVSAFKGSRKSSRYYSIGSGNFDEFYDAVEEVPKDSNIFKPPESDPNKVQAITAIVEEFKKRNTRSAIDSIKQCPVDLSQQGQLEMSEAFAVLKPGRYDCKIFLFEKMVVFTNIKDNNYIYQASINMRDLGITSLDIDSPIFHLYDSTRLRKAQGEKWRFELKAESADLKVTWTKKIERLLTQEHQARIHSVSGHVSDDDVFVNERVAEVFKAEEPSIMIFDATKDLIAAEEKYIADLRIVFDEYEQYFEVHSSISGIIGKSSYLFGNVSSILKKAEEFLILLRNQRKKDIEGIPSVFIDMASMFELYPEYAKNKPISDRYLKEIDFILKARQDELGDNISLATLLSKPIQRLTQYLVWLENLQKNLQLPLMNLERAIGIVKTAKSEMDDCFAIDSIKDCLIERNKFGSFIMSDQFSMQKPIKYYATVYLFENVVVFTKNDPNNIKTYMDSIEMGSLSMTPFSNEPLMFQLVKFSRVQIGSVEKYTFVLKSKSTQVVKVWIEKLQKILMEQFEQAKEKQDRISGAQINQRSTEFLRGRPPAVPPKNKPRCKNKKIH